MMTNERFVILYNNPFILSKKVFTQNNYPRFKIKSWITHHLLQFFTVKKKINCNF